MNEDSKNEGHSPSRNTPPTSLQPVPLINFAHQVGYPVVHGLAEQDHYPVLPTNTYETSFLPSIAHPQHDAPMFPSFVGGVPSSQYMTSPYDVYVPEYSLWNSVKSPQFWRSQEGLNMMQTPSATLPPFKLDDSRQVNPVETKAPISRPNFSFNGSLMINRDKGSQDPNFFEECFSPNRTRRLSIDSDDSMEITTKNRIRDDEDDETKDIFKDSLANPGIIRMRPFDPMKPDFLHEPSHPFSRQDSDPKEKLSMSELSYPIQLTSQAGMGQFKALAEKTGNSNTAFFKHKPTSPNRAQKTEPLGKTSTPSQNLLPTFEKAFGKNISKTKAFVKMPGPLPQLSSPKGARQATAAHKQSADSQSHDLPKATNDSNKPDRKVSKERMSEANDGPRCTCKKSKCLKLYCECFASQKLCSDQCNCLECFNKEEYHDLRSYFLQDTLEKNPNAFKSKFKKIDEDNLTLHTRGCNCKKTGCQKRYCECFSANTKCTVLCKCSECLNFCTESKELEVEKYHERVLRKRKRKTRTFVQSLLERLKDVKPQSPSPEQQ
jgi:hypothetical protein